MKAKVHDIKVIDVIPYETFVRHFIFISESMIIRRVIQLSKGDHTFCL